jgi:hypothetical protein
MMFTLTIECLAGIICGVMQPATSPKFYPTERVCFTEGRRVIDETPSLPTGIYVIVCRPVPGVDIEKAPVG